MERAAVIHFANKEYCYAVGKDTFMIRIRTKAGDMKKVVLHCQDKYITLDRWDSRQAKEMTKVASDGIYDYYEVVIRADMICVRYFFELQGTDGEILYYGNDNFYYGLLANVDCMFDCPSKMREEEMFIVPDWAPGSVVYQIFPDRFAKDSGYTEEWYKQKIHYTDKFYGNLKGIIKQLDHIKDLGVDVIYMTPIFCSDSNHKYDTIDYFHIDPEFGTKEDLCELVETAHEKGIRVILDAVFNHTSPKFFAFDDVKRKGEASEYKDWYYIKEFPLKASRNTLPNYETFAYYGGMPKLNCANPKVQDYILEVVRYWMREVHIDGWRLDVADEIGPELWRRLRREVKAINPEALIIGEIWHFAEPQLQGDMWDSVMNYRFYDSVLGYFAYRNMNAKQFAQAQAKVRGRVHTSAYPVLWNLIDSHDTARFLHQAKEKKELLKMAAAMQLLSPGMPMIYYGDEYGMTGGRDPENRRGMLWEEERQDKDLFKWYQALTSLRKAHPCLGRGEQNWIVTDNDEDILVAESVYGEDKLTVVFHNQKKRAELPEYAGKKDLLTGETFDGELEPYSVYVFECTDQMIIR